MAENFPRLVDYFAVYGLNKHRASSLPLKDDPGAISKSCCDFNMISSVSLHLSAVSSIPSSSDFTDHFELGRKDSVSLYLSVEYSRRDGWENYASDRQSICKLELFYAPTEGAYIKIPSDRPIYPLSFGDGKFSHTAQNSHFYEGSFDITDYVNSATREGFQLIMTISYSADCKLPPLNDIKFVTAETVFADDQWKRIVKIPDGYNFLNVLVGVHRDTYICIQKPIDPFKISFEPEIIDRYPLQDYEDSPLHHAIPMFCFNEKISLQREQSPPTAYSFILININQNSSTVPRVYITCLVFYEAISKSIAKSLFIEGPAYLPKCLCLVSHWPFIDQFKDILKEIYRLHLSVHCLPIERIICNLADEVRLPYADSVRYSIGATSLQFTRPNSKDLPHVPEICLEYLFRTLPVRDILTVWSVLLIERKVLLISEHKSLLTYVAMALVSLMFPFKWEHTLIPIITDSLRDVCETIMPYIIGISPQALVADLDIPIDAVKVDLDNGLTMTQEAVPRLPDKLYRTLYKRLLPFESLFTNRNINNPDYAFSFEPEEMYEFDANVVKDAFLEFQASLLKNYHRFLEFSHTEKLNFNLRAFLNNHKATGYGDFISKVTETQMFWQFIEKSASPEIQFFNKAMKFKRRKNDPLFVKPIEKRKMKKAILPNDTGISGEFQYKRFPILNPELYEAPRVRPPTVILTKPSNILNENELVNMPQNEWAKFLVKSIARTWLHVFVVFINKYWKNAENLILFALDVFNSIKKTMGKVEEDMFLKLIEVCGHFELRNTMLSLLKRMKNQGIEPNAFTYGVYVNAVADRIHRSFESSESSSSVDIERCIYITENTCPHCAVALQFEDIVTSWEQKYAYECICISCNDVFLPKISIIINCNEKRTVNLLGPHILRKELEQLISSEGEQFLLAGNLNETHSTLFWNMSFYFEVLKLPSSWMNPECNDEQITIMTGNYQKPKKPRMILEENEHSWSDTDDFPSDTILVDFVRRASLKLSTNSSENSAIGNGPVMKMFGPLIKDFRSANMEKGQLALAENK